MANSRPSSQKTRKRASQSSNGAKASASKPKPKAARSRPAKASAGASRARQSSSQQSGSKQSGSKPRSQRQTSSKRNGAAPIADRAARAATSVKDNAAKAKGPAVAVGAAAVGVAGGVLLRGRLRRRRVLGLPIPRALDHGSLSSRDVKSIAKTIGGASQSFAKTSKTISRDIERAGDQAERIGKILG